MHDTCIGGELEMLCQNAGHIIISIAGVNDQGQAGLLCSLNMDGKAGLLDGFAVGGIVVVKAGFPNAHAFRMGRKGHQIIYSDRRFFGHTHRVGACSEEYTRMRLGYRVDAGQVTQASADRDHARHASSMGSSDNGITLGIKIGKIKMAVAVNDFEWGVWGRGHGILPPLQAGGHRINLQQGIQQKGGRVKVDSAASARA